MVGVVEPVTAVDGVHVQVAIRGTRGFSRWYRCDASTPIGELMKRLSSMRATISFDDEPTSAKPPVRSLHTRFELTLGAAEG